VSNSPESMSGVPRLQGYYDEIHEAKARVRGHDQDLNSFVSGMEARAAATAAGNAVLTETNRATAAAIQAALAAAGRLSGTLQEQAKQYGEQADELENVDQKHQREATAITSTDGSRRVS
jgi:hypothetical protein